MKLDSDVQLSRLTSFKLQGSVKTVLTIEKESDLEHVPDSFFIIGGGSNIVISSNFSKPLIRVSPSFCSIEKDGDLVTCSAGTSVSQLLKWMEKNGCSGLEFAAGVPATIGGMVAMNFGCWGSEVSDYVESIFVYSKSQGFRWIPRKNYQVGYRWSSFSDSDDIILALRLKTVPMKPSDMKKKVLENINERKSKQPVYERTFGSVFKNPLPKKAGQLIESVGLKGYQIGDVIISKKHANFFENKLAATFSDTIKLIDYIKQKVSQEHNINLECEVKVIK